MGTKKIEVKIAERFYPLNIEDNEEKIARETADSLGRDLEKLDKQFSGVKDKQDLLAILAFQYKAELLELKEKEYLAKNEIDILDKVHQLLDESLTSID